MLSLKLLGEEGPPAFGILQVPGHQPWRPVALDIGPDVDLIKDAGHLHSTRRIRAQLLPVVGHLCRPLWQHDHDA